MHKNTPREDPILSWVTQLPAEARCAQMGTVQGQSLTCAARRTLLWQGGRGCRGPPSLSTWRAGRRFALPAHRAGASLLGLQDTDDTRLPLMSVLREGPGGGGDRKPTQDRTMVTAQR